MKKKIEFYSLQDDLFCSYDYDIEYEPRKDFYGELMVQVHRLAKMLDCDGDIILCKIKEAATDSVDWVCTIVAGQNSFYEEYIKTEGFHIETILSDGAPVGMRLVGPKGTEHEDFSHVGYAAFATEAYHYVLSL